MMMLMMKGLCKKDFFFVFSAHVRNMFAACPGNRCVSAQNVVFISFLLLVSGPSYGGTNGLTEEKYSWHEKRKYLEIWRNANDDV